ncbi:LL-diaminopimelate aminotransferase [Heyndrickxia ginsengihumi]|uniref:LL-diaminopimelate aminotransferase n=1 Tax=Heyndrickxia ginsengihumi TaxID=363870 RepID=UPI00046FEB50|nr:LL-diaminopimelate aminotransferase [Heyndrickxia ginsengihumi]MBE6185644.1 LL-diaminopimelate aminotransferase [Bacillus sp. (in: firmicutes)]
MLNIANRMNSVKTLIFSELNNYKKRKQQEGMEMIDLSIGSPDQPPPSFVIESLAADVKDPAQYGYTISGIDAFHHAVSSYYQERFNVKVDPHKEVIQLMGSQDGIVHLPLVFCNPGDIILVPDPGYTAYESGVHIAEAEGYPMPLLEENGFLPDLSKIPEDIAKKAKMMILNFPGNPIPALATKQFFTEVVAFAKKYNIIVAHDFAYSELIFDQKQPVSFLSIEGAKDVGVEFNSLSKSFNMAGTRIGFLCGNEEVIQLFQRLKSHVDYGIFEPIQRAAVKALTQGQNFLKQNAKLYERRRDFLINGLANIGWKIKPSEATMFIWAKIPAGKQSLSFTYELMDKAGVVVTPGIAFGEHGEGYVRIALVQDEKTLLKVIERIEKSGIIA